MPRWRTCWRDSASSFEKSGPSGKSPRLVTDSTLVARLRQRVGRGEADAAAELLLHLDRAAVVFASNRWLSVTWKLPSSAKRPAGDDRLSGGQRARLERVQVAGVAGQVVAAHVQVAHGDGEAVAELLRDLGAGLVAERVHAAPELMLSVRLVAPAAGTRPVVRKLTAAGVAAGPPTVVWRKRPGTRATVGEEQGRVRRIAAARPQRGREDLADAARPAGRGTRRSRRGRRPWGCRRRRSRRRGWTLFVSLLVMYSLRIALEVVADAVVQGQLRRDGPLVLRRTRRTMLNDMSKMRVRPATASGTGSSKGTSKPGCVCPARTGHQNTAGVKVRNAFRFGKMMRAGKNRSHPRLVVDAS